MKFVKVSIIASKVLSKHNMQHIMLMYSLALTRVAWEAGMRLVSAPGPPRPLGTAPS